MLGNSVDLTYKLQLYKPYGKFLIVLCIPKSLFDFSKELPISNRQYSLVNNVLSQYNPEEDLEYSLPPIFVRGYIDIDNNTIVENESFLRDFNFDNYKQKILDTLK